MRLSDLFKQVQNSLDVLDKRKIQDDTFKEQLQNILKAKENTEMSLHKEPHVVIEQITERIKNKTKSLIDQHREILTEEDIEKRADNYFK